MYRSLAEFWVWLLPKGKSHKTFDIVVSTNLLFLNFRFGEFGEGDFWGCSPAASNPLPLYVLHWLNDYFNI
jgi:hypothetical protein